MPRPIAWLAGSLAIINLFLLFPYTWWVITGVLLFSSNPQILLHINLDAECNLIAWYSSLLLLLVAEVCVVNFVLASVAKTDQSRLRYVWLVISGVTLFLSLDEVAQIHESVSMFLTPQPTGPDYVPPGVIPFNKTWIPVYAPGIVVAIGVFLFVFSHFLRCMRVPRLFGFGGLILWMSALALEFFAKEFASVSGNQGMHLEILLEEGSEIFGTTALLVAFAWYGWEHVSLILRCPANRSV